MIASPLGTVIVNWIWALSVQR